MEEWQDFDWRDFEVHTKEDGSLIVCYWYAGEWHINTSGSFGLGPVDGYPGSWRELFWATAPFAPEELCALTDSMGVYSRSRTYIFELCTPYNKIVRRYQPSVFLLGAFDLHYTDQGIPGLEVTQSTCDAIAGILRCKRPNSFKFSNQGEIKDFLVEMEDEDATFEGVILRDCTGLRYKWKTNTYVSLHRLKDNGNVLLPKNLVPIVLANEHHEVIAVMPETKTAFLTAAAIIEAAVVDVIEVWLEAKGLESQKDYAMKVKDHPAAPMLFQARKKGVKTEAGLRKVWRESGDLIVKKYFNDRIFLFDILEAEDAEDSSVSGRINMLTGETNT